MMKSTEKGPEGAHEEFASWVSQLRKGSLTLAVLATLRDANLYEAEVRCRLEETAGFAISEGVIYPVLRRLKRLGLVEAEWVEPQAGHPRRYFRLTDRGRRSVTELTRSWTMFAEGMSRILAPHPCEAASCDAAFE
jgi:PadR family transcriptional regulator, regulatory protein PadR